jgi:GT2 family glycosyltransferase
VTGRPLVAVVLTTYNGASYLERLWASLVAQRYPAERWRLIAVENGPDGDAALWLAARAPGARVLVPGDNRGYAGGNALGIQDALAHGDDYVLVVTQDTWLDPGALAALVDIAEAHPQAGAVQPKLLRRDADGRLVLHSRGNELHYLGVGFVGGDGEPDRPLAVRPIAYASGACVLYRSRALSQVGGFDPALFMYHEDSDLGWRLRLAGWEALLAPAAVVHHDYDFERNRLINVLTHYRTPTVALLMPALLAFEPVGLLYAARSGWLRQRLAVYAFFARPSTWRYLRAKRRAVQALRRRSDRDMVAWLTSRFAFGPVATPAVRFVLDPVFTAYWRFVRRLIAW